MSEELKEVSIQVMGGLITQSFDIERVTKVALVAAGIDPRSPLYSACLSAAAMGFDGANTAISKGLSALQEFRLGGGHNLRPCIQNVVGFVDGAFPGALPDILEKALAVFINAPTRNALKSTDVDQTRQILTQFAVSGANIAVTLWQMIMTLPQS